ncbi:MAG: hypothetical protein ACFCVK_09740 [Acidimicrobiales bacterium]
MAERQLIDRIVGGDAAAHARALSLYAGAEPAVRTEMLNQLAGR